MASDTGNQSTEANKAFTDFMEESIQMLQTSARPFLICSGAGIPRTLFMKDKDGDIWVSLISELEDI